MALNTCEGSGSAEGNEKGALRQRARVGEGDGGCLDSALALGYVERLDPVLLDQLDHVRAVLVKNVR